MFRGKGARSTEEKRSVMPSSSVRLRTYSSPSTEKASGGVRVTKLCCSSGGDWSKVDGEGVGGVVTGVECCCVGSESGGEILFTAEERLAYSGKITGHHG